MQQIKKPKGLQTTQSWTYSPIGKEISNSKPSRTLPVFAESARAPRKNLALNVMNANILEQAKQQAAICSVFGNARRVLIMWSLVNGEKSVGELADEIGTSLQNTSQHLRLLKDKDFVRSRRVGQTIYYRIVENETMESCFVLRNVPLDEAVENQ